MFETSDCQVVFLTKLEDLYYKYPLVGLASVLIVMFIPTILWLIGHLLAALMFFGMKYHSKDRGHWLILGLSWIIVIGNFPALFYLLVKEFKNDRGN